MWNKIYNRATSINGSASQLPLPATSKPAAAARTEVVDVGAPSVVVDVLFTTVGEAVMVEEAGIVVVWLVLLVLMVLLMVLMLLVGATVPLLLVSEHLSVT